MSQIKINEDYSFRKVQADDFEQVVSTLSVLTNVGNLTKEKFAETVEHLNKHPDVYNTVVIINREGAVVAIGSIIIEQKIIHECGKVGHIEDIAVNKNEQGKRLGYYLIQHLTKLGKQNGCYKVILDCAEKNIKFYEKCGYKYEGAEMAMRF